MGPEYVERGVAMSSLFYCLITSTNLSEFSSLGHTCLQYIIFRCMFFLSVNVFRYIIYQFLILLDTGSLCFTSCISCNTFSSIYGSSKHPFSEFQPLLQVSLYIIFNQSCSNWLGKR